MANSIRRRISSLAACASLLLSAQSALAHITLATKDAAPGNSYQAVFDVPHGCAGAPTTALTVVIPDGIRSAKPQPKPGWTLVIEREALAVPIVSESGRQITERVKTISWTGGPLPDDEFDSFTIVTRLPAGAGPLYFPTIQTCGTKETRWTEVPPAGKTPRDVRYPPPYVTLTGAVSP